MALGWPAPRGVARPNQIVGKMCTRGIAFTTAPGKDEGVVAVHEPAGPVAVVMTTGPVGVAPTAEQVARRLALGADSQETSSKKLTLVTGSVAAFQLHVLPISDPLSSVPDGEAETLVAVITQSATSEPAGFPQATTETADNEVRSSWPIAMSRCRAWTGSEHRSRRQLLLPSWSRSTTQVVVTHETPVIDPGGGKRVGGPRRVRRGATVVASRVGTVGAAEVVPTVRHRAEVRRKGGAGDGYRRTGPSTTAGR